MSEGDGCSASAVVVAVPDHVAVALPLLELEPVEVTDAVAVDDAVKLAVLVADKGTSEALNDRELDAVCEAVAVADAVEL